MLEKRSTIRSSHSAAAYICICTYHFHFATNDSSCSFDNVIRYNNIYCFIAKHCSTLNTGRQADKYINAARTHMSICKTKQYLSSKTHNVRSIVNLYCHLCSPHMISHYFACSGLHTLWFSFVWLRLFIASHYSFVLASIECLCCYKLCGAFSFSIRLCAFCVCRGMRMSIKNEYNRAIRHCHHWFDASAGDCGDRRRRRRWW